MKTKLLGILWLIFLQTNIFADDQQLASADNVFAFKLLKELVTARPAQNIFISPYGAETALQMTANGAAGQTKMEMQHVLGTTGLSANSVNTGNKEIIHLLNTRNTNVILNTANAIWIRQGFPVQPDFISANEKIFDAPIGQLNFSSQQSVDVINSWASEKTHGKIPKLLDAPPG